MGGPLVDMKCSTPCDEGGSTLDSLATSGNSSRMTLPKDPGGKAMNLGRAGGWSAATAVTALAAGGASAVAVGRPEKENRGKKPGSGQEGGKRRCSEEAPPAPRLDIYSDIFLACNNKIAENETKWRGLCISFSLPLFCLLTSLSVLAAQPLLLAVTSHFRFLASFAHFPASPDCCSVSSAR